jgi:hypothetical protein
MEIRREDIEAAARHGTITVSEADALWRELEARAAAPAPASAPAASASAPATDPVRIDAAGAAIVAAIVTAALAGWLLLLAWERWGGTGGFAVAGLMALAFVAAGRALAARAPAAGGVLVAAAICLVPVAVRGLQLSRGWGPDGALEDLGDWVTSRDVLPLAAAAASTALALLLLPFPGIAALLPVTVWAGAMSIAPVIFDRPSWSQRALLSALVGLVSLGAGFALDRRTRRDYASGLYLVGLVAFWGGLTTYHAQTELSIALYAAMDVWLVGLGLAIDRRVFAVFGVIGLAGAFGHLAESLLEPAALPFALAGIVLGTVAAALGYLRVEAGWRRALVGHLPGPVRRVLPPGLAR